MINSIEHVHQGRKHRIKDAEKALILGRICTTPGMTRKRLVENLNLRPTTISNVVQELQEQRLVQEGEVQNPGSQGRPERELVPNYNRLVAIAVRVLSRTLIAELVNFGDQVLYREEQTLAEVADDEVAVRTFVELIQSVQGHVPPESELLGAGVSLPGIVNPHLGRWLNSSRWHNVRDFDATTLERHLNFPVRLEGMQVAELRYLLERDLRLQKGGTLLVHWGYGIGASYSYEGEVMTSSVGSYAEIGHVKTFPGSRKRCMCGDFGCLETEASLWALIPEFRRKYPDAPEQEHHFADYFRSVDFSGLPGMSSALNGVGLALSTLYRILFPDRVLVFGPFTQHEEVAQKLKQRFLSQLPHYAPDTLQFEVLSRGFEGGESFGTTQSLFSTALAGLLTIQR